MKRKVLFGLLAFVLLLISCKSYMLLEEGQEKDKDLTYLIYDVKIFTGLDQNTVIDKGFVFLADGQIKKIGVGSAQKFLSTIKNVENIVKINGIGKTLLPGLIDFHTHMSGGMLIPWKMGLLPTVDFNFHAALYSGITTVVDMSGLPTSAMQAMAKKVGARSYNGPTLLHSGMGFTGKGAHPVPYLDFVKDNLSFFLHPFIPDVAVEIENEKDFHKLDKHLKHNPDFTKIYLDRLPEGSPLMTNDLVNKVVIRSHKKNVPVVFHIGSNENLKTVIEANGDGTVHFVYKEKLDPALARQLAKKNIFVVPTVVVWHNYYLFATKESYNHYSKLEFDTIYPNRKEALANPRKEDVKGDKVWRQHEKNFNQYVKYFYNNVKVLKEAGVTILAGSDSPNLGIAIGGSLHTELQHLVKAGLSPVEALKAATSAAVKVLSRLKKKKINFGTIEKNKIANLLLVNGDPTKNIKDTENISEVFKQGRRIKRLVPTVAGE